MVFERTLTIEKKGLECAALQRKSTTAVLAGRTEPTGGEAERHRQIAAIASRAVEAESPRQHHCYLHYVHCLSQFVQAGEHLQPLMWEARNKIITVCLRAKFGRYFPWQYIWNYLCEFILLWCALTLLRTYILCGLFIIILKYWSFVNSVFRFHPWANWFRPQYNSKHFTTRKHSLLPFALFSS